VRQACFLAWIVLNVVYLTPWLLIGPLYMRKQERIHNLYDRVSGLHPVASAVQVSKRSGMPAIARRVVEQSA
jgi:hypothetical protein